MKEEPSFIKDFGPILIGFTRWVIDSAIHDGIKRLYFLSRDGYMPYLLAKEMAGSKLDIRYLKVSRVSIRSAEYALLTNEEILNKVCLGGIDVTLRKILRRALPDEDDVNSVLHRLNLSEKADEILNRSQIANYRDMLRNKNALFELIKVRAKDRLTYAEGYLEQEGLLEDVTYALVDSGWVGSLQKSIQNLITHAKGERTWITGYYFGLYEIPKTEPSCQYRYYYFGPIGKIRRKVYFSNCLFESILSSPEGMTLSYAYREDVEDGIFYPVDSEQKNPNAVRIKENGSQLIFLARQAQKQNILANKNKLSRHIRKLMAKPSIEMVTCYGDYLFCDDIYEDHFRPVAARLSKDEIHNLRFINRLRIQRGRMQGAIHESAWIEGSIVRHPSISKRELRHAAFYKYILYIRKSMQQWIQRIKQGNK